MVYCNTTMANHGFEIFSNNNYLPDIGQFNNSSVLSQQTRCRTQNLTFPGNNGQGVPFSFAVPTQANSYTFTFAQTYQPRGIYSNPVNHQGIAPGIGASWQHSVPNQMPWGDDSMLSQITSSGISTFCATSTITAPSMSIYSSIPSCSSTPKRPKRHSSTDIEREAPSPKCLVTEERMAAKMEGLSLQGMNSPAEIYQLQSDVLDFDFSDMMSTNSTCSTMSEEWKRFRDIENRLNAESDEEDIPLSQKGVRVHISKSIAKNILESPSLLPQKILNDINKPCMEIVLWKSPGGFDRENLKKTGHSQVPVTSSSTELSQINTPSVQTFSLSSNTFKENMDTENFIDDFEDSMDL